MKVLEVPLWSSEKASAFMLERVSLHQKAAQGVWDECTEEERWVKDKKWAVMKKGVKKAIRLYDSEVPATMHAETDPAFYIQFRPGESVRCESYCSCAPICPQFKRIQDAKTAN